MTAELQPRVLAYLLLCAFGALHWAALVDDAPLGRVALVVLVSTAGGVALALTASRGPRRAVGRLLLRAAIEIVTAGAALAAIGVPARLLAPRRWDELSEGIASGLAAIRNVSWPYAGNDEWVTLTILLGIPLFTVVAAGLAFWPARRRAATALSLAGLAVLVTLFGVPVTEYAFTAELARGAVLFALVAAWLWLPRVAVHERAPALAAVAVVGVLALPVAAVLEGRGAWVDYESWQWFGRGAGGSSFDWRHGYGPMDWPRTGTTLLWVRSQEPHYWKVEALDRFDGLRWRHSGQRTPPEANVGPVSRNRSRWSERIGFTVRALRSQRVVGAGATEQVFSDSSAFVTGDGPTYTLADALSPGDSYEVRSYVPEPAARDLRAAPTTYQRGLGWYTRLEVPREPASIDALDSGQITVTRSEPVDPGLRDGSPPAFTPLERAERRAAVSRSRRGRQRLLASPYRRVYRRARRFARGDASPYVVARRIERYLKSDRFEYSERPRERRYPLASFVLEDRRGYCQHFSGAMALMLRMNGIPARVAAGFAPGRLNEQTGEYRVRDLDAHSWVEVHFPELGWVAFDPTPSAAPAAAQTADREGDDAPGSGAGGAAIPGRAERLLEKEGQASGSLGPLEESGSSLWLGPVAAAGLLGLGALVLWLRALSLRHRRRDEPEPELRELESALERLGYDLPEDTTLLELERRLARTAGPPAARYARRLRERRYSPGGAPAPDRRARRELRSSLTRRAGPIGRARGFIALPPHGFHAPPPRREPREPRAPARLP